MKRLFPTILAAAAFVMPAAAIAHVKLVSSTPAASATVTKPTKLTLTFSETFLAPLSGAELTMTSMPGMAQHAPMPIKGFKTSVEGKTMTLTMPRALPAGTYLLKWHLVGADQHKMEGSHTFIVK